MTSFTSQPDATHAYLQRLGIALRPLSERERESILAEIESHIAERAETRPSNPDKLEGLGTPEELAQRYLDDFQLLNALGGSSPGALLKAILARASGSAAAFLTGFGSVLLYIFALSFIAIAILKPIAPRFIGLWRSPSFYTFGAVIPPPSSPELMGYWIVPLGAIAALLCYVAATALMRRCARHLLRERAPLT